MEDIEELRTVVLTDLVLRHSVGNAWSVLLTAALRPGTDSRHLSDPNQEKPRHVRPEQNT